MISISPRKLPTIRFRFDLCEKKRNPLRVPFHLSMNGSSSKIKSRAGLSIKAGREQNPLRKRSAGGGRSINFGLNARNKCKQSGGLLFRGRTLAGASYARFRPQPPMNRSTVSAFFDGNSLAAVMDLIFGFPNESIAFIWLFMTDKSRQGRGEGTKIIRNCPEFISRRGL